jgi:hypothetical protein
VLLCFCQASTSSLAVLLLLLLLLLLLWLFLLCAHIQPSTRFRWTDWFVCARARACRYLHNNGSNADAVLWGGHHQHQHQHQHHHHPHLHHHHHHQQQQLALSPSSALSLGDPRALEFYLPTLWLAWTASPFPSLPPAATAQIPASLAGAAALNAVVVVAAAAAAAATSASATAATSAVTAAAVTGGVAAFAAELHAARAGLLIRAADAYKRLRNRVSTRACCMQVHIECVQ